MAKLGPEYDYRRPYDLPALASFNAEVWVRCVVAATWAAIANPCDSKNTGFRASKRQGGRQ